MSILIFGNFFIFINFLDFYLIFKNYFKVEKLKKWVCSSLLMWHVDVVMCTRGPIELHHAT